VKQITLKFKNLINSKYCFWLVCGLATFFGTLSLAVGKDLFSYLATFLAIFFLIFSDHKKNLYLIMYCQSIFNLLGFPLSVGGALTYLVIVYLVVVLVDCFLHPHPIGSKVWKAVLLFCCFVLLTFSTSFLNRSVVSLASAFSFYAYMCFLIAVILEACHEDERFQKSVMALEIGLLVDTVIGLVCLLTPNLRERIYLSDYDKTYSFSSLLFGDYRFQGLNSDQNEFSMCSLIPACFFLAFNEKFKKHRALCWSITMLNLSLGFLGKSKSYLICLLFFALFYVLKFAKKKKDSLIIILGIAFCVLGFFSLLSGSLFTEKIFSRFINVSTASGYFLDYLTTSRWSLWITYSNYLLARPVQLIFGQGIKSMYSSMATIGTTVSHNFFLNTIWEFGVIGTLLFFAFLVVTSGYRLYRSEGYRNVLCLLPIATFFLFGTGLALTGSSEIFFYFVLFFLSNQMRNTEIDSGVVDKEGLSLRVMRCQI